MWRQKQKLSISDKSASASTNSMRPLGSTVTMESYISNSSSANSLNNYNNGSVEGMEIADDANCEFVTKMIITIKFFG